MTARSLLWLVITVLSLGCRSGGDPPVDPPIVTSVVIESVAPTGLIGTPGDAMSFSATMRGGSGPVTYEWNFGTGATPATSTESAPQIALGVAGTYSGSLRLTDGKSEDVLTFEYRVTDTPVVQSVTPSDPAPTPLGTLDFAVNALGEPTSFAWDFGGGAIPQFSTEPAPRVTVQEIGGYVGTLVVSNEHGSAEAIEFSYAVAIPDDPTWRMVKLPGETPTGPCGLTIMDQDGGLVIAYEESGSGSTSKIHYLSTDAELSLVASDFQSHVVIDNARPTQSWHFLTFDSAGKPIMSFLRPDPDEGAAIHLAIAITLEPQTMGDWQVINTGLTSGLRVWPPAIARHGDELLICYYNKRSDASGTQWVASTEESTLSSESEWAETRLYNKIFSDFAPPIFSVVNGLPIIASSGNSDSRLFRTDVLGQFLGELGNVRVYGDFQPDVVAPGSAFVTEFEGVPAVLALHNPKFAQNRRTWFHLATNALPDSYEFTGIQISPDAVTRTLGLTAAHDRLAALYANEDTHELVLARQQDRSPLDKASWKSTPIAIIGGLRSSPAAMTVFNDQIVVAFVDPVDGILTLTFAEGNY